MEKRASLINSSRIFMALGLELEINELAILIDAKEYDYDDHQVIDCPTLVEGSLF